MDTNAFDILSNEVISHIIAYLDAVSLFRFCGCSKRLLEFNNISNEHWRILYSIQWLVDEPELCLKKDRDWKEDFKSRFTLEKNIIRYGDKSALPHEIHFSRLLRSATAAETIAALDDILSQNIYGVPRIFLATAILKLIRANELPPNKIVGYLSFLGRVDASQNSVPELIGVYSVAVGLLDSKYSSEYTAEKKEILLFTLKLVQFCNMHAANEIDVIETYPALKYRLLDVIEKSSVFEIIRNAMEAFNSGANIGNRPVICQKICQAIDQSLDPELDSFTQADYMTMAKDFIKRLVPYNGEFMVAQGVLEKLFAVVPKVDYISLYHVMGAIECFAYEKNLSKQIAKNELVLASILDHAKNLRSKATSLNEELSIFDSIFGLFYALSCSGNIPYLFNSPYLEYLLPYLAIEDLGEDCFANLCTILAQYIRYGIETVRLSSIHKRIEPHLKTLINGPYFKYSITIWQTLYCGMKLPLYMAKSLIERIIPELDVETEKSVKRSYSELLANMVHIDSTLFADVDMKLLYDYYSQELIIDDRTNDTTERAKIPFALCFVTAGSSIPQFAEFAIKDEKLLEKMYSLYDEEKESAETIYLVVGFFSYLVKIPGWDNRKGLAIIERWGTTMPLNTPMFYIFTMTDTFKKHFIARDNTIEVLCFATWVIARMSKRQDGRDGLKQLDPDTIEWLSSHSDPRLRKHMSIYQQNIFRAEMGYIDEF